MNKETIIKRLIDEGHCRVWNAASILNLVDDYVNLVDALHVDGNINTEEAICLLNKNPTRSSAGLGQNNKKYIHHQGILEEILIVESKILYTICVYVFPPLFRLLVRQTHTIVWGKGTIASINITNIEKCAFLVKPGSSSGACPGNTCCPCTRGFPGARILAKLLALFL